MNLSKDDAILEKSEKSTGCGVKSGGGTKKRPLKYIKIIQGRGDIKRELPVGERICGVYFLLIHVYLA
jgi:hypothetical protein